MFPLTTSSSGRQQRRRAALLADDGPCFPATATASGPAEPAAADRRASAGPPAAAEPGHGPHPAAVDREQPHGKQRKHRGAVGLPARRRRAARRHGRLVWAGRLQREC